MGGSSGTGGNGERGREKLFWAQANMPASKPIRAMFKVVFIVVWVFHFHAQGLDWLISSPSTGDMQAENSRQLYFSTSIP
jgi:hypothetical protein